jgi:glycosyltransferase involved in cell wall biosynthesis
MSVAPHRPRALVLASGDPASDPRIGWVASTLAERFDVIVVGTHRDRSQRRAPEWVSFGESHSRVNVPVAASPCYTPDGEGDTYGGSIGWFVLAGFAYDVAGLDAVPNWKRPKISLARHQRINQMKEILSTNASLIQAGRALGPIDLVVAADLDSLAAGVVLKHDLGARLIYDAHEYWPYSFPIFRGTEEEEAWVRIERLLVGETDARFTVSTGLAQEMSKTYGTLFDVLPNAAPLKDASPAPRRVPRSDGQVEFLFLGGFAPDRGILKLIEAWRQTPQTCILMLQGPESRYKLEMIAAAKETGLLGTRILFPPPVKETDLIARAANADVGLIPYEPTLINHIHCSPNKLSQYMAAGLPILANATRFVEEITTTASCGVVVDFETPGALASEVTRLAGDPALRTRLGHNARLAFETFFHWEAYANSLIDAADCGAKAARSHITDPRMALLGAFRAQAPGGHDKHHSAFQRYTRLAMRYCLKAAWHGVPFLRVFVLSQPRLRRRAENMMEL